MEIDFYELRRAGKTEPAFMLHYEERHTGVDTGFLAIQIVESHYASRSIRNYSGDTYSDPQQFGDLHIYCYLHANAEEPLRNSMSVEYRSRFTVDVDECKSMFKTLRKIQRGMEKIRTAEGTADTPGEYVRRVGKILGIKHFIIPDTKAPSRGFGYDANRDSYRWQSLVEGKDTVNWQIRRHYSAETARGEKAVR